MAGHSKSFYRPKSFASLLPLSNKIKPLSPCEDTHMILISFKKKSVPAPISNTFYRKSGAGIN